MLKKYFKIAWRNQAKNKVTTTINIIGLAIGISACMMIYLIVHFEFSFENFHPDKERVYRAVMDRDNGGGDIHHIANVPYGDELVIRTQFTGIDKVAGFFNYYFSVTVPDGNKKPKHFDEGNQSTDVSDMIITDPEYFSIFRYEWLAGNAASALNDPFKIVLAESKGHQYFGAIPVDEMIGKELIYNDSLHLSVSGIVKDLPNNTNIIFKDFISISTIRASFLNRRGYLPKVTEGGYSDNGQVFVKLSEGVKSEHYDAQTEILSKQNAQNMQKFSGAKTKFHLQPLSDIHFNADYGGDLYSRQAQVSTLYGLMCIAVFILSIAVVNFANLSTAQSIRRAKEIGIRKVMGSSRMSLVFQFLCEAFLVTIFAAVLALLMLKPALAVFHEIVPREMAFSWQSPSLYISLLAIAIITSILAGIYPAKVLSSYKPAACLKDQGINEGNRKNYVRKALIVFQFAMSLLFIIGTLVINNQIRFMLNKDLGFKRDAIINFQINPRLPGQEKYVLAEKIRELTGVDVVSVSQDLPQENSSRGGTVYCQDKGTFIQQCIYRSGDEYYVPLYGIKIIAGRNLIPPTGKDSVTEFLLNETAVRQLGFQRPEDAIGHVISYGQLPYISNTGPVVGIVADFNSQPLNTVMQPVSVMASKDLYFGMVNVKLSTKGQKVSDFTQTIAAIEKDWKEIYPSQRFNYVYFDSVIAGFYEDQRKMLHTVNLSTMLAIFISALGLFGISAFIIVQRTKEIGIRKILGATVTNIVGIMVKEFAVLVGLALTVAAPISWYIMSSWLNNFAYRIHMNIWIALLAGISGVLIALVTVSYHTIKAAVANPINSLKTQ
ncbi:MAG TPA: FtsX-like permease family protein [Puia sp.]|nr:FtsX-like permease family protein [Puia sp.]